MTWNYRLVRTTHADGTRTYAIHEAYYDARGRVRAITEEAVEVFGETPAEARRDYTHMAEAFKAPILAMESIPEPVGDPPARRKIGGRGPGSAKTPVRPARTSSR